MNGNQNLLPLVKQSSTYKMIVPEEVEKKIRYLIRIFPNTEWSGILFYSRQGNFENNDIVLTCVDIYPMDIGTAGWTEFKESSDIAAYMAQNMELFECESGLVHSHHGLGAYFSGQDLKTLQLEGADTNCFVSLIVDTKGEYKAAITRRVTYKNDVSVTPIEKSYQFFGDGIVQGTLKEEEKKVIEKTVVEYFMLDVERHTVDDSFKDIDDRLQELKEKKKKESVIKLESHISPSYSMQNLFEKKPFRYFGSDYDLDKETLYEDESKEPIDSKIYHDAVCKLLTCNLILDTSKFDLKQWVTRHMDKVYKKLFPSPEMEDDEIFTYFSLNAWIDFAVDFLAESITDEITEDDDYAKSSQEVYKGMLKELKKYKSYNPYVQKYINYIEDCIYE